ncbi:hypothetical protein ACIRPT_23225 [Streptomyces sp. NPDC101227]|uniref:hypothetical protein n=1 Tax=Streptomyces sp. NPDC101227 TaxID=3366136 RepID=UPI003814CF99
MVTVSALAASLAGCMSVSDAEPPKPSGSAAQQHGDGRDAQARPGGLAPDGRGGAPRRTVRGDGERRPADDGADEEDPSADATPTTPERSPSPRPAEPSGPVPSDGKGHGGHGRPSGGGSADPLPSSPGRPSSSPASPTPTTPTAEPTQPPSGPPQPSSQASGQSPSASMPESAPGSMFSQVGPGEWPDA